MKDIEGIEAVLDVLRPHWKDIEGDFNRHNEQFLTLLSSEHDTLGRVLKAHLIIENFMNGFLALHLDNDELPTLRLSFHQKAMLLPSKGSSAAFVRPGILQLNAVRNKFAHRIEYEVQRHEVSAIDEVLQVARRETMFSTPLAAIEAFAPVACAFLAVPPKHLQELFLSAFQKVHSHLPEIAHAEYR